MYTFHAIDTVTGTLSHKEELNRSELDQFMIAAESKFWACQLICGWTGKKVVYTIDERGQWVVHHKEQGE